MSKDELSSKGCACASRMTDLLRATRPKRDPLRKTICPNCSKEYWINGETDYCFNCESHRSTGAGVA